MGKKGYLAARAKLDAIRERQKKEAIKRYYQSPQTCKTCGKAIKHVEGKPPSLVRNKSFCDSSCAATYTNSVRERKVKQRGNCKRCGRPLGRPLQIYCSSYCQMTYQYEQYIKRWKDGKESGMRGRDSISSHLRRYLFEKYNGKCCKCGWDKIHPVSGKSPLEGNHIDGDCTNNVEYNLELLCPNCHSLTPNYGARNRGKSTRYKYKAP